MVDAATLDAATLDAATLDPGVVSAENECGCPVDGNVKSVSPADHSREIGRAPDEPA